MLYFELRASEESQFILNSKGSFSQFESNYFIAKENKWKYQNEDTKKLNSVLKEV